MNIQVTRQMKEIYKPDFVSAKHLIIEAVVIDDKLLGLSCIAFDNQNISFMTHNCSNKVLDNIHPTSRGLEPWIELLHSNKNDKKTKDDILELLFLGSEDENQILKDLTKFITKHKPDYFWSYDMTVISYLNKILQPGSKLADIIIMPVSILLSNETNPDIIQNPLIQFLGSPMHPKVKAKAEFTILSKMFEEIEVSEQNPIITNLTNKTLNESLNQLLSR